jgi:hypothetical protein
MLFENCRYLMYGDISAKAAHMLGQPAVGHLNIPVSFILEKFKDGTAIP